ncbi:sensor histidine kinase [Cohnella sp. GCM10012308]|uniref:cache domain-containing sensor histidine kinase n=1 Tax=Cohnella sp. GCM10012308 TaxID=3317329 RepID=UPI0036068F27
MRDRASKLLHNISFRLFLVCFIFVLSSEVIVSALSYRYIKNEISSSQTERAKQLLLKEQQYMDLYIALVQNTIALLSSSSATWHDGIDSAQAGVEGVYRTHSDILTDAYLIRENLSILGGNTVTKVLNDPMPSREELYRAAYSNAYGSIAVSNPYQSFYSGWTVTFTKALKFAGERMVIAVDLNLTALQERMDQISRGSNLRLAILDDQGRLILEPAAGGPLRAKDHRLLLGDRDGTELIYNKDDVFQARMDGAPVTVMRGFIPRTKWIVLALSDSTALAHSLERLESFFFVVLAVGLLLSVVTAAFVARMIRTPVYYLIRKMSLVKQGDLNVTIPKLRNDEFGELTDTFNAMLERIRTLLEHVNVSERKKKEMEIQVLQSQINPHFLYNALGSISNVVDVGRYEEVDDLIGALIAILEYGITDFSDSVSLEQELRNVRDYLHIQSIRYDRAFELVEEIDPEALAHPVLRMALQPIVENSVFHGYSGGRLAGVIRIAAASKDGQLVIDVSDEGVGMTPDKAATLLLPGREGEPAVRRKRIGLYNIHQRIRLNYGEDCGLAVWSEEGKGTRITLRFPDLRASERNTLAV